MFCWLMEPKGDDLFLFIMSSCRNRPPTFVFSLSSIYHNSCLLAKRMDHTVLK